jgi:Zn-finger nucleic acid-binding protein
MAFENMQQKELRCIDDGSVLQPSEISGQPTMRCPQCGGAWLTVAAFHTLEDSAFDPDMVKGQMRYGEHPVEHPCPHCDRPMTRFRYRGYNLELEACPQEAGF